MAIDEEMLAAARAAMPELPAARAERFERELGLSAESAQLLAFRGELGDYFEAALAAPARARRRRAQALANWVTRRAASARLGEGEDPAASRVHAGGARRAGRAGGGQARERRRRRARCSTCWSPRAARTRRRSSTPRGSAAIGGGDELAAIVAAAIAANADAAERVRGGNEKAIGPIVGAVMRETQGPRRRRRGHAPDRTSSSASGTRRSRPAPDTSQDGRGQILDVGPKAARPRCANIVASTVSSHHNALSFSAVHPAARGVGDWTRSAAADPSLSAHQRRSAARVEQGRWRHGTDRRQARPPWSDVARPVQIDLASASLWPVRAVPPDGVAVPSAGGITGLRPGCRTPSRRCCAANARDACTLGI